MKTFPGVALIIPLLFSCAPKKTDIPGVEAPSGPVMQALEQQGRTFTALRAIAEVRIVGSGNKRVLENVGIVLDGHRRFRIEAFGPLGQSLLLLTWDGTDTFLRMTAEDGSIRHERGGLERVLGEGLEVRELCAVLSGSMPGEMLRADARLYCGTERECVLVLQQGERERRVRLRSHDASPQTETEAVSHELYRSGKLLYTATFDRRESHAGYRLPMDIVVASGTVVLTIAYQDVEVNIPVSDEAFSPGDPEGTGAR